jgi:hypothetical protein
MALVEPYGRMDEFMRQGRTDKRYVHKDRLDEYLEVAVFAGHVGPAFAYAIAFKALRREPDRNAYVGRNASVYLIEFGPRLINEGLEPVFAGFVRVLHFDKYLAVDGIVPSRLKHMASRATSAQM